MDRFAKIVPGQRGVFHIPSERKQCQNQSCVAGDPGAVGRIAAPVQRDSQVCVALRLRRGDTGKWIQEFPFDG